MPTVAIEGFGKVAFPDTMSPEEISRAIETEILPKGSAANESGRQYAKEGSTVPALMNVAQGLTFGFGDELAGAARGAYEALTGGSYDKGYGEGRDFVRGAVEEHQRAYPVAATIGNLAGSLLQAPLGAVGAVGKMGALARGATTIGMGAGFGALQGAGDAESLATVPEGMLTGGALGGASAGVLSGAGTVASVVRNQVAPRLPFSWGGAQAHQSALRQLGLAIVRDETTGRRVLRRLEKLGPEARIFDAAGENTRNLLDTMATMPGKTQDAAEKMIRGRQIGRADRMDAIPNALGGGAKGDDVLEMLAQSKAEAAGPLYEKVDSLTVPITGKLADLADRPVVKAAIEQARTNVANEGAEAVERFTNASLAKGTTPLRFWDDVKKALDDVIGNIKRGNTNTGDSTLRSAVAVKRQLVDELDRLTVDPKTGTSVYKEARDVWGGLAAAESALEDGRKALSMSPGEIRKWLFRADASEVEAFRLGTADALREKIGTRAGQTNLVNAPFDRNTRMLLREVFGDDRNYRESLKTILQEGVLKRGERVGRGSQTAGREARMEDSGVDFVADAANAATSAAGGNVTGVLNAARALGGRLKTPEVVRDEIGRILLMKGGDTLRGASTAEVVRRIDKVVELTRRGYTQEAAVEAVLGANLLTQ